MCITVYDRSVTVHILLFDYLFIFERHKRVESIKVEKLNSNQMRIDEEKKKKKKQFTHV